MEIIYGGVHLTMLTVDECYGEAIYDDTGVDYLYTRYVVKGSTIVNGQVDVREIAGPPVSYRRTGVDVSASYDQVQSSPDDFPDPPPANAQSRSVNPDTHGLGMFTGGAFGDGVFGGTPPSAIYSRGTDTIRWWGIEKSPQPTGFTDEAIRQRLITPRHQLFVFSGTGDPTKGEVFVRSPVAFDVHCDARNGPLPRVWGFRRSFGDADTLLCDFEVETCICEMDKLNKTTGSGLGPLLSNRFSMTHSIDETGLTRVNVTGTALFRTDWLYGGSVPGSTGFPLSPDSMRFSLFLPVAWGHVREDIVVRGRADGTGVDYSYTDRRVPVHFPAGPFAGASKISAVHTQSIISDGDLVEKAAEIFDSTVNRMVNTKILAPRATAACEDGLADALKELAAAIKTIKPPLR